MLFFHTRHHEIQGFAERKQHPARSLQITLRNQFFFFGPPSNRLTLLTKQNLQPFFLLGGGRIISDVTPAIQPVSLQLFINVLQFIRGRTAKWYRIRCDVVCKVPFSATHCSL